MNRLRTILLLAALVLLQSGCGPIIHAVIVVFGGTGGTVAQATQDSSEAIDQEPEIAVNERLTVLEDSNGNLIDRNFLIVTDDGPDDSIDITITTVPQNGSLRLNGTIIQANDMLTQVDINDGNVTYDQDSGLESALDFFDFVAEDSAGQTVKGTFTVQITPVNDPPTVSPSPLTVAENALSTEIAASLLNIADPDNVDDEISVTVTTAPTQGQLRIAGVLLDANGSPNSFTLADLNGGFVTYSHLGGEIPTDSFEFTVADLDGNIPGSFTFQIFITPVNDTPTLINSSKTVVENSTNNIVSSNDLLVTDPDNLTTDLQYELVAAPSDGLLLVSGVPIVAGAFFTQEQVNNGQLAYTHNGNENVNDIFQFQVRDGAGGIITTQNFTFTISNVDDAPVLTTNNGLALNEGDTVIIQNSNLLVEDVDDPTTAVVFTINTEPSSGSLLLNNVPLGTSSTFTAEDLNTGLISYVHSGTEVFTDLANFTAADAAGENTGPFDFNINITPVNDVPTLVNSSLTTDEASMNVVLMTTNFLLTDPDNTDAQLQVTIVDVPSNGTLSRNGSVLVAGLSFTQADVNAGLVTYTHDGGETTSDLFNFQVSDGAGGTLGTTAFNITVNPVNDAPVISVQNTLNVEEESTTNVIDTSLLALVDPDNANTQLIFTLESAPTNGTLKVGINALAMGATFTYQSIVDGALNYDHRVGETFSDSFTFSVSDGVGGTIPSTVFNIVISGINDAPVQVNNQGLTLNEAETQTITSSRLLASDVDNTPAQLTYRLLSATTNGTLMDASGALTINSTFSQQQINDGEISYSHNGTENFSDSFDFQLSDGTVTLNTATFALTILAVNDFPILAQNNTVTVNEESLGTALTNAALQVTDTDNNDTQLVYTLTSVPMNGVLKRGATTLMQNSTFTQADINAQTLLYDHDGGESTSDSFQFTVSDGAGGSIGTTTFNIVVTPVNDSPVLGANSPLTVLEAESNVVISRTLLNFTDVDNTDSQLVFTVGQAPQNGTLMNGGNTLGVGGTFSQQDINNNSLNYTHNGSETSSDSFQFNVSDGAGGQVLGTTFSITVTPQNDAPVLARNTGISLAEGGVNELIDQAALEVTDVDNEPVQIVYTITALPVNGTISRGANALMLGQTLTQDQINGGLINYDHNASETTSDSVSFSVSDSSGGSISNVTVAITITGVNDSPVLFANMGATVFEASSDNIVTQGQLEVTDVDNTPAQITYLIVAETTNGTFKLNNNALNVNDTFTQDDINNGRVAYDHSGNETTSDVVRFTVSDGAGGTIGVTPFNWTVTPVNDAPTLTNNNTLTVDEASSGNLIDNSLLLVEDVDNTALELVYTVTTLPTVGSVLKGATAVMVGTTFTQADVNNGLMSYTNNGAEVTMDSFQFTLSDGAGGMIATTTFSIAINAVNDPPVLAMNGGLSILEEDLNTTIGSGTLQITDVDNANNELVLTVTRAPANGTLLLNGMALAVSGSFTQEDIDNNLLTYDHNGLENTSDNFQFTVSDGAGGSIGTTTFSIAITPVNDAPTIGVNMTLTVGEASINNNITDAFLRIDDVDNAASQRVLTLTAVPMNGTLRQGLNNLAVSGTITQAQIDAGTLFYDHDGTENFTDSFAFTVSDGAGGSIGNTTFSIVINADNDTPTLVNNNTLTVLEESTDQLIANTLLMVTDTDNVASELTFTVTTPPANGTLTLNNVAIMTNGTFTQADIDGNLIEYDHNGLENTSDSFVFTVSDGAGGNIAATTFNIIVTPVNDAPTVGVNMTLTVDEATLNNNITNSLLRIDDVDNSEAQRVLTLTAVPVNGTLRQGLNNLAVMSTITQAQIDAGTIFYDHNGTENFTDSFEFTVSDGAGGSIGNTTFSIVINPVNDAPILVNNNTLTVLEESTNQLIANTLLSVSDTDNNTTELTYTLTTAPANGTLEVNSMALAMGGTFTQADIDSNLLAYDHNGLENTSDSFQFTVSDGAGGSLGTTTFRITVTPVNDAPTIGLNNTLTVAEGSINNTIANTDLRIDDVDNAANERVLTLTAVPVNGTLRQGLNNLAVSSTITQAVIDAGTLFYDHDGTETTSDSFRFTVSDGAGGTIAETTFNIIIGDVNDPPVLVNNQILTVDEASMNNAISTNELLVTDIDNADTEIIFTVTTIPTRGSLLLSSVAVIANGTFSMQDIRDGNLAYTHNGGELATDSFQFTVSDGAGGSIGTTTFSISVNPINDAPTVGLNNTLTVDEAAVNQTIMNTLLRIDDVDNDASQLTLTITSAPSFGTLFRSTTPLMASSTVTQSDINAGTLNYTHDGSENFTDSFQFTVSDGAGGSIGTTTFNIMINPLNDAPTIQFNLGLTVAEGDMNQVIAATRLAVTDVDNGPTELTYTLTNAPATGSLALMGSGTLNVNGTFTQQNIADGLLLYTHNGGEDTADSFQFTVSDGAGGSIGTTTFSITVTPVNDAPVVGTNNLFTVDEASLNQTIMNSFLRITDADNVASDLTLTVTTAPTFGTLRRGVVDLMVNSTFTQADIDGNTISYTHDGTENFTDSFQFTVSDGAGGSIGTTTFNITINPVNDDPTIAQNNTLTVAEGAMNQAIQNTLLQVTDVDNVADDLTFTLTAAPVNGSLILTGVGTLVANDTFTQTNVNNLLLQYTHAGGENTSDSFQFTVSDGAGGSIGTTTFSIAVTPVNDDPVVANNNTFTVDEAAMNQTIMNSFLRITDADNVASDLTLTVTTAPTFGTLRRGVVDLMVNSTFTQADIDGNTISYTHDGTENFTDSFQFTVSDGAGGSIGTTTFSITINPLNDAPVIAANLGLTVAEGAVDQTITAMALQVTDVDNAATELTFTLTTAPTRGDLILFGSGTLMVNDTFTQDNIDNLLIRYTHGGGEQTSDSFQFTVSDGAGGSIATTTFAITVTPVNDTPTLTNNNTLSVNEGATNRIIDTTLLQVDDVDNAATELTYTLGSIPVNGTLQRGVTVLAVSGTFTQQDINNFTLSYSHNGTETTTDSFSVTVSDGAGGTIASFTFNISISPVNVAPTLDNNNGITVNEGSVDNVITSGALQVSDVDNAPNELTYTVQTIPVNGTLINDMTTLAASGTFTQDDIDNLRLKYTHDGSETTTDSFQFTVSDGAGGAIGVTTFSITITSQNTAPTVTTNLGLTVDEAVQNGVIANTVLRLTDPDNSDDQLTYTLSTVPTFGTLMRGVTTLAPSGTFTQSDINSGVLTYTHNGTENFADSFQFTASDGSGGNIGNTTFSITINPVNDTPTLVVNAGSTFAEASVLQIVARSRLEYTDTDNTAAQLTYTVTTLPTRGNLFAGGVQLNTNDTFTQELINNDMLQYTHDGSEEASDSFQFTLADGAGGMIATQTFNFTITPVNDSPTLTNNNTLTVNEGATNQALSNALLQVDDVDNVNSEIVYTVTTAPVNGNIKLGVNVLAASGTFTQADVASGLVNYDHDGSETTADSFQFTVSDGAGGTIGTTTFSITVNPQNVTPVLNRNNTLTLLEGQTDVNVSNAVLQIIDADNNATEITYTLAAVPTNGNLQLGAVTLGVNDTFTQDNIDNSQLNYDHDGSETVVDTFTFTASDGSGGNITLTTFNFNITPQNDTPSFANNNALMLSEGDANQVITTALLQLTDPDNSDDEITFTVTSLPTNGSLKLGVNTLIVNQTFTQADIDAMTVTYSHAGGENTSDMFQFTVSDGAGGLIGTTTFNISITAVNDVPVVAANTGITAVEGSVDNAISNLELQVTDPDNSTAQLTYTLTVQPPEGTLFNNGVALNNNDTFTQENIDNNLLTYNHGGGELTSDSFQFTVSDGAGGSIATTTFNIVVTAVNDTPVLATNAGLTVVEGASNTVLGQAALEITDVDNATTQIIYTIAAAPGNGTLRKGATTLAINDTFTQQDINSNLINYVHGGNEVATDSFQFTASDSSGGNIANTTFTITLTRVNDAPVLAVNNGLSVNEGDTGTTITTARLQTTDVDIGPADTLTYTLTAVPANGTLLLSGVARTTTAGSNTFTQADIDANNLSYDHDAGEATSDSFTFTVSDGNGGSIGSTTFNITIASVNDTPTVGLNTGATFTEGSSNNTITNAQLRIDDADLPANTLTFTITTAPANGTLRLGSTDLSTVVGSNTFTQTNIDSGLINYSHNGGETTSDSFTVNIADGNGGMIIGLMFTLTINQANDAPVLATNNGLTVNEASTNNTIGAAALETTDVDVSPADTLTYTLTAVPANGSLLLSGVARTTVAGTNTFTQADINANSLTYNHDGGETTSDSFTFNISDGNGGTINNVTFSITVTPQNDAPTIGLNTGLTFLEGSTENTISNTQLRIDDVDLPGDTLTFTPAVLPTNGTLKLGVDTVGTTVTNFTQADINAGLLNYSHNGSETTSDSMMFSVSDGNGGVIAALTVSVTITPQNDAPTLAVNNGLTVNEGATNQVIDQTVLRVSDVDLPGDTLTYTVTSNPSNGNLNLMTFTQANINANLVNYTHNGGETTSDSFTFTVSDGNGGSIGSTTFNITINPVNDTPSVGVNAGATVNEGASNVTLTNTQLRIDDADLPGDTLTFTLTAVPANGTLRLGSQTLTTTAGSNTFTQANIDANLINYSHDGSETTSDSFTANLSDGNGGTITGLSFSYTINRQNDDPVLAVNNGLTVNEGAMGTTIGVGALQTTDADTGPVDTLTYTLTAVPANGTLFLSGVARTTTAGSNTFTQTDVTANNLTYTHNGGETTSDSFTFTVSDGNGGTIAATTFSITVTPVNDDPTAAVNAGATFLEGSTNNTISNTVLRIDDADLPGDTLTFTLTTAPANGTLRLGSADLSTGAGSNTFTQANIDSNLINYTHAGGENTSDSFVADISDGNGGTITGLTFSITITPQNDAPVLATNAGLTVNEGAAQALSMAVLEVTDVDLPGDTITYTVTVNPTNGALNVASFTQADINGGGVTYTHNGGETTSDSFTFTVSDGNGGTIAATTFSITVTPVNDDPTLGVNAGATFDEASSNNTIANTVLRIDDVDLPGDTLTFTLTTAPANGTLRLGSADLSTGAGSNTFTQANIDSNLINYTHAGGENTSDSFVADISDGNGGTITGLTFSITITPQNDAPVLATNAGLTVNEGAAQALSTAVLEVTDVDLPGDTITYTVTVNPANGALNVASFTQADINGGGVTYTHNGGETTSDSFTFTVSDGNGGTIAATTFSITVTPQNDDPTLGVNAGATFDEASSNNTISSTVLRIDDVDLPGDTLTFTLTTAPANGTLRLGSADLSTGAGSNTFTQSNIDNNLINYTHAGGENTSDSFVADISDGNGGTITGLTFSITITPQNDAPVVATNAGLTVNEGAAQALSTAVLEVTDVDLPGDTITYTVTVNPANGALNVASFTQADINGGGVTYTHNGGETTSDSFTFTVSDGNGGTIAATTFSITVTPVNDDPTLGVNAGATFDEGSSNNTITNTVLRIDDVDLPGDTITFTLTTDPANGTLRLGSQDLSSGGTNTFTQANIDNNGISYTHAGGENTSDSFVVDISDGNGGTITGLTFSITITPQNDAPVLATNAGLTVNEGAAQALSTAVLEVTDVDLPGDTITYTVTVNPANGALNVASFTQADINGGGVTYTHNGGETTSDSFTFTVSDGNGGTIAATTFSITVTPQNDDPVLGTNNEFAIQELSSNNTITTASLQITDADNTDSDLTFTVATAPTRGTLMKGVTALAVTSTFTQQDINSGVITYSNTSSNTPEDSFSFTVSDGAGGTIAATTFSIRTVAILSTNNAALNINTGTAQFTRLPTDAAIKGVTTASGVAFDGSKLFVIDSTTDILYSVDPDDGMLTTVGHTGLSNITGLAVLSGTLYAIDSNNTVVQLSTSSGAFSSQQTIATLGAGATLQGLAAMGTTLFAIDTTNGELVEFDPSDGSVSNRTVLAGTPVGAVIQGLAFDGTNFITVDTNANQALSITTAGVVTALGAGGDVPGDVQGLAPSASSGLVFAINNSSRQLFSLSPSTGQVIEQVGSLGYDQLVGLAKGFTHLYSFDALATRIVRIDPSNSEAVALSTDLSAVLGAATLTGLAFDEAANSGAGALYGINDSNELYVFSRSTGGVLSGPTAITGLAAGATLEGLAVNATNQLVAVDTTNFSLVTFTSGAAVVTQLAITGDAAGVAIQGLGFDSTSGNFFGINATNDMLTQIDVTAASTHIGLLGLNTVRGVAPGPDATSVYVVDQDTDLLATASLTTGVSTTINAIPSMDGLAFDSDNNVLYGSLGTRLFQVDTDASRVVFIGDSGQNMPGLAFDPNGGTARLFTVNNAGTLFEIDPATAGATQIGVVGAVGVTNVQGLAYDRVDNILFGVDNTTPTSNLLQISTADGTQQATARAITGFSATLGLGHDPQTDTLYGIATGTNQIISINQSTGTPTVIGSVTVRGTGLTVRTKAP